MNKLMKKLNEAKKSEKGFTLVELLVVILIIGILIAIAVPAFLGQGDSAETADTKVRVDTAFANLKSIALDSDTGNFAGFANDAAIASALSASEPDLTFAGGTGSTVNTIYVVKTSDEVVDVTAESASGATCTASVNMDGASTQPACS